MTMLLRCAAVLGLAFLLLGCGGAGAGGGGAATAGEGARKEASENKAALEKAEKELGKDHPMVKQLREQNGEP
jgi:hypothetical protein